MNAVTLKYLLLAEDKASERFRRTGNEAEGAGKKVGAMHRAMIGIKVVSAAAGAGLLGLFKVGFDEAKDASAGTAQLEAGIKSTGNAAHVTVGGLNDLAGAIQGYSGQTDDSIVASEQLLLTFTNIHNEVGKGNDIFNQATKATADMAAKMGGDASKYAVQLGKALNDPVKGVTALQKIGVSFTDGQKKQITALVTSGQTMKAQKIILGELHKEFGGAAKAAGQSLPGQLARGKRAFEDIAQSVVTQLMPIITWLANFIVTKVMPAFKAITDFILAHKTTFAILAAVIGTIIIGLKAWAIAQAVLNTVMAANPIALVVIAVAALVAALVVAWQRSETFRRIVKDVFRAVGKAGHILWHDVLKPAFNAIKKAFEIVFDALRTAWRTVGRPIFELWKVQFRIVRDVVLTVVSAIGTALRGIGSGLRWAWDNVFSKIFAAIKSGIRAVRDVVHTVASKTSSFFKGIGNGLQKAWDVTIGPIIRTMIAMFQRALDLYNTITGKAVHVGGTLDGGPIFSMGPHGNPKKRAGGGRVFAGVPYLVGEERAEMFTPDVNGTISPRVGAGGGTLVVNVRVEGALATKTEIQQAVKAALENDLNGGGTMTVRAGAIRTR